MKRQFAIAILSILLLAVTAFGRPGPQIERPIPRTDPTPWIDIQAPGLALTAVDTTYLLGGPDRLDGSFEDASGQPDWHGWTHHDLTLPDENHWHVSTYWAYGINGHGAGNHALVCVDEDLPACSEADTIGGVASSMFDDVEWSHPVPNPNVATTVRLTAFMHLGLADVDWDFLELFVHRDGADEMIEQWTGTGDNLALDFTTTIYPEDYLQGAARLYFRVWSDGGWDDEDCRSPSHGACQIDDISVYFDGQLATFDDFEPGSPRSWYPSLLSTSVGDFAALRSHLPDADPCQSNATVQVSFIDDGEVVPGAGPTYCINHCYGPGSFILNNDGGLLADDPSRDWFLENEIRSPVLAWPSGLSAAQLEFDVYRHEDLDADAAGIFFIWHVRSTADEDPADLENADWKSRNFVFYGPADYLRFEEPVSDLIVPDARWAQVSLGVTELGWHWGWNGSDGTPAPYFDNVAFKVWDPDGPAILVEARSPFADAFPQQGYLDAMDLASNSCRLDPPVDLIDDGYITPGDSLVVNISALRHGAEVYDVPTLHFVLACNAVFDGVRPASPDPDGILRGSVAGTQVYNSNGTPLVGKYHFDLPDEGWFYPGDRLRYYVTASDNLGGDIRTSVWPADTTSVLDFSTSSSYPSFAETRALPTVSTPVDGVFPHPGVLFWDETEDEVARHRWLRSLGELGFAPGVDFDHARARSFQYASLGLGATATAAALDGYGTILYSAGNNSNAHIEGSSDSSDDLVMAAWLDAGDRNLLLSGDRLMGNLFYSQDQLLWNRLQLFLDATDITQVNGGSLDLRIHPLAGNGVLDEDTIWGVNGYCDYTLRLPAVSAQAGGQVLAHLDPAGQDGGPHAAVVAVEEPALQNRILSLATDLRPVIAVPGQAPGGDPNLAARTVLLQQLLVWFGESGSSAPSDVPVARTLSVVAAPNPFNPSTTISFDLPAAADARLDIHDLQGRKVRSLVHERMPAGGHDIPWHGCDDRGRSLGSGMYFYSLQAGDEIRRGKLTLLK